MLYLFLLGNYCKRTSNVFETSAVYTEDDVEGTMYVGSMVVNADKRNCSH